MDTGYRTLTIITAGVLLLGAQVLAAPADRGPGPWQGGPGRQGWGNRPDAPVPMRPGAPAWQPRGPLPLDQMLRRADADQDGALSAEELEKLTERASQLRARMQAQQTRGRGQRRSDRGWGQRFGRGPGFQPGGRQGPGPWSGDRPRAGGRGPAVARGPRGRGPLPLGQMLQRADANQDGALSAEEFGKLTEQARQFCRRMQAPEVRGRLQGRWEDDPSRWSGRGSRMQGGPRRGPGPWSGDRARSGGRGPVDVRSPRGRGPLPLDEMFQQADKNGDGALSKEEVEAFRGGMRAGPPIRQR